MSSGFKHLQYEQRKRIRQLMDDGVSIRAIARSFGMAPNSIYREVKRGTPEGSDRYDPDYAQARYRKMVSHRGFPSVLQKHPELAQHIADLMLKEHYSPCKVADILQTEDLPKRLKLTKETIYLNIDKGLIPGVTRKTMRRHRTKLFNHGQVCFPKWVLEELDLQCGDVMHFEVKGDKIILEKADEIKSIK